MGVVEIALAVAVVLLSFVAVAALVLLARRVGGPVRFPRVRCRAARRGGQGARGGPPGGDRDPPQGRERRRRGAAQVRARRGLRRAHAQGDRGGDPWILKTEPKELPLRPGTPENRLGRAGAAARRGGPAPGRTGPDARRDRDRAGGPAGGARPGGRGTPHRAGAGLLAHRRPGQVGTGQGDREPGQAGSGADHPGDRGRGLQEGEKRACKIVTLAVQRVATEQTAEPVRCCTCPGTR